MIFRKYANSFQPNSAYMPALQSAKRKLELQQPKILHLVPWLTGCRHGPCPSPGPGQSKTCIRWGLMRLQYQVNERVEFSISKTKPKKRQISTLLTHDV